MTTKTTDIGEKQPYDMWDWDEQNFFLIYPAGTVLTDYAYAVDLWRGAEKLHTYELATGIVSNEFMVKTTNYLLCKGMLDDIRDNHAEDGKVYRLAFRATRPNSEKYTEWSLVIVKRTRNGNN